MNTEVDIPGDEPLDTRVARAQPLLVMICRAFVRELEQLGFAPDAVRIADPDEARYRLQPDPASGDHALVGEWRDTKGQKLGSMVFHAEGSFYVEHDVAKVHPGEPTCFVEAMTAWGRGGDLRFEPRFLDMVD